MAKEPTEYKYPLIMKGSMSGRLILMTSHATGTVVGSGNGGGYSNRVGQHSNGWAMHSFKPFKG